ncbi:hypothetical protein ND856_14230 [Leptospira bandrabouensis]|uniref:hypothetical protein n=1 Tax=Leptospira bandrabouensis TaxID=2484903 RepID=UPI00223D95B9|nr:hypothetical protein [Leptospira bandrabouensis]MCW7459533.1 hypothetical protein [Leptospira bandrabouensis]MCW7478449.1 hypothetical protein [Leptospira bandrabouensis]MCW7486267.1 hypothetical protein [Leptospira bandrabouensis]
MVGFIVSPTRTWNRITPADGDLINPEIARIYNNLNYLKDAQENPDLGFHQLNNTPSSFAGKVGQIPLVNQVENGLVFQKQFGVLDTKWSSRKFDPSPEEPWFRKDLDHTFNIENWPLLIEPLRNTKWEIGATSIFNVTSFSPGTITRLQLEDSLTVRNLIRALLEDYHYSKPYTATTNADTADDDSAFSNWGMIVRIVTDIGTGSNAPKANQEFRIRYLTSLANTLSVTNRYICIDKDTSSSATTGTGTIEITPYRIAIAGVPNPNQARWRKQPESGLMTPGAVFYSGTDLVEVPANARVRDRDLDHWHQSYNNGYGANNSPTENASISSYTNWDTLENDASGRSSTREMIASPNGGTPRKGPGVRVRSSVEYSYGNGVIYIA